MEHGLEHRVVEIGFVGGQEADRMLLGEGAQSLELALVVLE